MGNRISSSEELAIEAAGGSVVGLVGTVTAKIAKLTWDILLARLLGPGSFGIFAFAHSLLKFSSPLGMLGADRALVRFAAGPAEERDTVGVQRYWSVAVWTVGVASTLCAAGLGFFGWQWGEHVADQTTTQVILLFALALPVYNFMRLTATGLQATRKMASYFFVQEAALPILNTVIILVLVSTGIGPVAAAVVFLAVVTGTTFFGIYRLVRESWFRLQPTLQRLPVRQFLAFGLPVTFLSFSYIGLAEIDRIMIGLFRTTSEVGIYTAASGIGYQVGIFYTAVSGIFIPLIAARFAKGESGMVNHLFRIVTRWIVTLTVPLALILVLYGTEILTLLFGSQFSTGALALTILVVAKFLSNGTGLTGEMLVQGGKERLELGNVLGVLSANVLLNIALIPRWGLEGAALATGISLVGVNAARLVQVYRCWHLWPYDARYLKPLVAGAASTAVGLYADSILFLGSVEWIVNSILMLAVYTGCIAALGISEDDRFVARHLWHRLTQR